MPPERIHSRLLHELACYHCRARSSYSGAYRLECIPELTAIPSGPEYASIAVPGVLLSVDADALHTSIDEGVRQRLAEGAVALRAVLSSVLHSEAFSPKERADLVESTREQLKQGYGLNREDFGRVLSEPMLGLGSTAQTALEQEIKRWDPVWEGGTGEGGLRSDGMEMIYFLVANWCPPCDKLEDETASASEGEVTGSHIPSRVDTSGLRKSYDHPLLKIVRDACLDRLICGEEGEEATNRLFQRIVCFIAPRIRRGENSAMSADAGNQADVAPCFTIADYDVSLAYERFYLPSAKVIDIVNKGKSAVPSVREAPQGFEVGFTTLLALHHFRSSISEARNEAQGNTTGTRRGGQGRSTQRSQPTAREHSHPYLPRRISERSRPPSDIVSSFAELPQATIRSEFLAVRRMWAVSVGSDVLELEIITPGPPVSSHEHANETVSAEVRLVCPVSRPNCQREDSSDSIGSKIWEHEYVFTFPEFELPGVLSTDLAKSTCATPVAYEGDARQSLTSSLPKKMQAMQTRTRVRLEGCFSGTGSDPSLFDEHTQPKARSFDDFHLLHEDGALMLELRVLIRKTILPPSSPFAQSRPQNHAAISAPSISAPHLEPAKNSYSSTVSAPNSIGKQTASWDVVSLASDCSSAVAVSRLSEVSPPESTEDSCVIVSTADTSNW